MTRKQFTFYRSFHESIGLLPTQKEQLQAYKVLCEYALNGKLPKPGELKSSVFEVFSIAQPTLNAAMKRSKRILSRDKLQQQEKEKEEAKE